MEGVVQEGFWRSKDVVGADRGGERGSERKVGGVGTNTASEDDSAETSLAGEGGGIDTPLNPEDEQISLVGVGNGTIV